MLLLKDGFLVHHNGKIEKGSILIEGKKIRKVGLFSVTTDKFKVETIDCSNKIVMPGFINAHCHAPMSILRGYADDMSLEKWLNDKISPAENLFDGEVVYWGTLLAIAEMIRGGVTSFADMYFYIDEMSKAVNDSGIRAVLSRGIAMSNSSANIFYSKLQEGENMFHNYNNAFDNRLTIMLAAHSPYNCPPKYLKIIKERAINLGIRTQIHLSESTYEVEQSYKLYGKSPVRVAYESSFFDSGTLASHCIHVNDEDIYLLAANKVIVAHNPSSNMILGNGIAPVYKMLNTGIEVAIGTDGAASNNKLDMLAETRLTALLQKGKIGNATALKAKQVLQMATNYGAKALGLGNNIGQIKREYYADLIILDLYKPHWYPRRNLVSQLIYAADRSDIETVIINGKIVMKNKKLLKIDEEKLYFNIERIKNKNFYG